MLIIRKHANTVNTHALLSTFLICHSLNDKRGHMFRHSFRGHVLIYLFWYVHLSHSSTMGVQRRGYKWVIKCLSFVWRFTFTSTWISSCIDWYLYSINNHLDLIEKRTTIIKLRVSFNIVMTMNLLYRLRCHVYQYYAWYTFIYISCLCHITK